MNGGCAQRCPGWPTTRSRERRRRRSRPTGRRQACAAGQARQANNQPLVGQRSTRRAFGAALLDQLAGLPGTVTHERDDGYVQADSTNYISDWNDRDSWAIARTAGRVLDIGAGAGRVCLRLAESGLDALLLDVSAGAVEVCRPRSYESTSKARSSCGSSKRSGRSNAERKTASARRGTWLRL